MISAVFISSSIFHLSNLFSQASLMPLLSLPHALALLSVAPLPLPPLLLSSYNVIHSCSILTFFLASRCARTSTSQLCCLRCSRWQRDGAMVRVRSLAHLLPSSLRSRAFCYARTRLRRDRSPCHYAVSLVVPQSPLWQCKSDRDHVTTRQVFTLQPQARLS